VSILKSYHSSEGDQSKI